MANPGATDERGDGDESETSHNRIAYQGIKILREGFSELCGKGL